MWFLIFPSGDGTFSKSSRKPTGAVLYWRRRVSSLGNTLCESVDHKLHQFSSVAQSCPTLCDPMNRSTPGLPVHHQLPEFTQTHVHRLSDAIQPSHPLLSPSPTAPIPPSIRVFSNESVLHIRWPKYWHFSTSPSNECSGLISFRINWFDLLAVQGTLKSLLHTTVQKHQFFCAQPSLWSNSHIHT